MLAENVESEAETARCRRREDYQGTLAAPNAHWWRIGSSSDATAAAAAPSRAFILSPETLERSTLMAICLRSETLFRSRRGGAVAEWIHKVTTSWPSLGNTQRPGHSSLSTLLRIRGWKSARLRDRLSSSLPTVKANIGQQTRRCSRRERCRSLLYSLSCQQRICRPCRAHEALPSSEQLAIDHGRIPFTEALLSAKVILKRGANVSRYS